MPFDGRSLRDVLAKMTPGPWRCGPGSSECSLPTGVSFALYFRNDHEDAAGIVLLRNAAPALLDRLDLYERLLREALEDLDIADSGDERPLFTHTRDQIRAALSAPGEGGA